jgi:hypothetical protein
MVASIERFISPRGDFVVVDRNRSRAFPRPVLDRYKRLVGILSLRDIALSEGAGSALCGISEPGGEHSQSLDGGRGMRGT